MALTLVSLDPFRSLGIPGVTHLDAEGALRERKRLEAADWVLFPQTWQVNTLVYGLGCRIFPSLPSYHLGRDKVEMTRLFEAIAPEHTPVTLVLPAEPASIERAADELGFPLVAKVPRSSMGRGVFLIESARVLRDHLEEIARHGSDILYVQEYLPSDRDLRVVWVGDRVVAAYWRVGGDGFHHNVARGGELSHADIPDEALAMVSRVAGRCGVNHAGFDVLFAGGRMLLLEFNVLFGNRGLGNLRLGPVIHEYLLRRQSGVEGDLVPAGL